MENVGLPHDGHEKCYGGSEEHCRKGQQDGVTDISNDFDVAQVQPHDWPLIVGFVTRSWTKTSASIATMTAAVQVPGCATSRAWTRLGMSAWWLATGSAFQLDVITIRD